MYSILFRRLMIYRFCAALSLIILICLLSTVQAQNTLPPIGYWREHLNYQQAIQVIKGDQFYCATTGQLFTIDNRDEITRFSRISGLSSTGIQCIAWDSSTQQTVIAYSNSIADILKKNTIRTVGDIYRSTVSGNKTIYHIFCSDGIAYTSTGLGIILINLTKYEIKDTWIIGSGGTQVKVNTLTKDNSFFYAATEEGLKRIPVTNNNPADFRNWETVSGKNNLPAGDFSSVVNVNNRITASRNDSIWILNGQNWQLLYTDPAWPIINISASENKLLISQRTTTGNARVIVLQTNGSIEKIVSLPGIISLPRNALSDNGNVWVADQFGGLSRTGSVTTRFIPNGPPATADGEMIFGKESLFAAAGSVNLSWNYQFNRNGIYNYDGNEWSSRSNLNTPVLDSVLDFITIAPDPVQDGVWAGSFGGGLVYFPGSGIPLIYKKNNSSLQAAIGDPFSYRVSGLAFDAEQQLWVSNYGAAQQLHVRKKDGNWKAFTIPFQLTENAVSQLIVDDAQQIWILSPKGNGLICFNNSNTVDNTADDRWKYLRQGTGSGNLPSNNVLCIAKDKDGFIWVGTDQGIGIIQCAADIFNGNACDAVLPVVQFDRFAGLLFRNEIVQAIAVDGANRKWVGTKNGLWLLSNDGKKIIYRFTAENSPLLSNDIKRLAINPVTGEVFIATPAGICSFRSTATEGTDDKQQVLVFPNPVSPSYSGTIAIRGLPDNALVKITELSGKLIYQTRSLGGQAIWDGKQYTGQKAASGVYLVLIRDDKGTDKIATKIVITAGQ
jgi:hypothetical protein